MRLILAALAFIIVSAPSIAFADEQLTPLAADGDWVAFEHRESMEDPPDFCIAAEAADHFFLRADNNDIEVRYSDDSWSLPNGVTGTLKISINGNDYAFEITDNTNNMIIAAISQDQLEQVVGDMNKAASMSITAGSAPTAQVSLSGSNQAVTAFLTCANISQPGNTGGVNPFQSPTAASSSQ